MARFAFNNGTGPKLIRIPRWALILGVTLTAAFLLALFVLAAGLALILLPVVALAGLVATWFGVRKPKPTIQPEDPFARREDAMSARRVTVIEGEYEVIDRNRDTTSR